MNILLEMGEKDMNKKEKIIMENMKLMVDGFGKIAKIYEDPILELPFPEVEYQRRYELIHDILLAVNDNLK